MDDIEKRRAEKAQKKLDDLKSRRRRDYWEPKPGVNPIRFLPNWNGDPEGDFYRETGYHWKLGTDRNKNAVCLLREGSEKCPVCDMVKELYRTKNKEDAELAKEIRAKTRIFFNIIDLNDPTKGVQVFASGVDVLEQVLGYCANPKYGYIPDPETGRNSDLIMTAAAKTKSGFNEYDIQPDPDRTPIANPEWLLQMVDLDALIKPTSFEELDALLTGRPVENKGEEKEEKPIKTEEKAGTKQACFGKFSPDDAECQKCVDKSPCEESRKEKGKTKVESSEPKEVKQERKPKEAKEEKAAEPGKSTKPSSDIKGMLEKLRTEKERKKVSN